MKTISNAAGRKVLDEINGEIAIPFKGVGKYKPDGKKTRSLYFQLR